MARLILLIAVLLALVSSSFAQSSEYFSIHVIDAQTGRGIPLATLTTTSNIQSITDSAGWVAFREPDLMNREVWFSLEAPGYKVDKDSFGYAGFRATTTPGKSVTVKMQRTQIAERLYRLTGQGIYSDSQLLGKPAPIAEKLNGAVVGQDSVQAVPYRGRLFWLWGDTSLPQYPLGIFHVTAAWSDMPGKAGLDPAEGVRYTYLPDAEKPEQARKAAPGPGEGPVWIFGLFTINDDTGKERLVGHFTRQKGLEAVLEHGLMVFNDKKGIFERLAIFDLKRMWQNPTGNAVRIKDKNGDYIYFTTPFLHTRVRATWADIQNQDRYEALTFDEKTKSYRWQSAQPPTSPKHEAEIEKRGGMTAAERRYDLRDAATGEPVSIHSSSIDWNPYRKRWVLIGEQIGGKESLLGEIWYAESANPNGPWKKAVKIATHPKYTFYNVRHHVFFDQKGGQVIYFEGTYTATFSGNPVNTPRYEYNQLMYRLDLSDARLRPAQLP